MKNIRLGIIGCGNMASAIIRGLTDENHCKIMMSKGLSLKISVSDTQAEKLKQMEAFNVVCTTDNVALLKESDFIILAIKPQTASAALSELDFTDKIVISIMAGTSLNNLNNIAKNGRYVRVMPNLNARIGMSFSAYACQSLTESEEEIVCLLLNSFGSSKKVEESKMNAITGLTGSAPAFVFQFIKALTDAGICNGFDPITARQMAVNTVIGSAKLVESSPNLPICTLIESVCSKGGTTIEGVKYLQEKDLNGLVKTAVVKAIRRAEELEKSK